MAFSVYCVGVGAYSFVLEHWPTVDSLYFSVVSKLQSIVK